MAEFRRLSRFTRRYDEGVWSRRATAESYTGALRRRYVQAADSLQAEPLGWGDSRISAFLKADKLRSPVKEAKPRLIFPRSPRFNLELARRLKPFEHWLWGRLTGRVLGMGHNMRLVAKGLTPRQRANLIVRKFSSIDSCVCFEVDGKAFEAHVGPHQLSAEHGVYRAAFPRDKGLRRLLREQLVLSGQLPCGAKFSRSGGRASGDFNTGMGNTIIFLMVVVAALKELEVPFDCLVDGDNAIVFVPHGVLDRVMRGFAPLVLASSGHEVTVERPVRVVEGIRFGGSAPVFLGPRLGWTMVRDWVRVLSGAFASHRWLREPAFAREWMRGVSMCELSLARGVPILQAWALQALEHLGGGSLRVRAHPHVDYFVLGGWLARESEALPVSGEARLSFELAFGVTPEDQVRLESSFAFSFGSGYRRYSPLSYSEFLDEPSCHSTWRE